VFFHSDDKFTNGFSVQRQSNLAEDWNSLRAPAWAKFGRRLPGLAVPGLYRRMSITVGQNIQTPDDLFATEPVINDVPYAGSLGLQIGWTAFDERSLLGYGLFAGVVGPWSGAEQVQRFVHRLANDSDPQGWDHQLRNELLVNFNSIFKRRLATIGSPQKWSADFGVATGLGMGTATTYGEAGLAARWGRNMPRGFASAPSPVSQGVTHDATLANPGERRSVHFSVIVRTVKMPHVAFLDGGVRRDGRSIAREDSVREVILGIHLERPSWGLHVSLLKASDLLTAAPSNPSNDFGTIAVDWNLQ
jgi:hypothetical protein